MEKEIDPKDYTISGIVIDSKLVLSQNKDSFLLKTRDGEKNMNVSTDNITNVYLK